MNADEFSPLSTILLHYILILSSLYTSPFLRSVSFSCSTRTRNTSFSSFIPVIVRLTFAIVQMEL